MAAGVLICHAVPAGAQEQATLAGRGVAMLTADGLRFKDLNRNGVLDAYEDWRRPVAERVQDLVGRMTLEEKAGTMMHANPPSTAMAALPGAGTAWDMAGLTVLLRNKHITAFLNRLSADAANMAVQSNALQAIAEETRLGIPVSLSTDPRNQFQHSQGVSVQAGTFTQWPDPTGLAATGDDELVRRFADSVRQEYLAVGIQVALSPQADLALNPRWHRTSGTFGSDPQLAARMVLAYVSGMQNGSSGIGRGSVVSVVKHWVGYGATMADGFDAHNYYGRTLDLTAANVEQQIVPFTGAFAAHVGSIMPAYGKPAGELRIVGSTGPIEHVGAGFSRQLLTELLRGRFGFDGVVVSDWHITNDCGAVCTHGAAPGRKPEPGDIAMPWGVEELSRSARYAKAARAGVNQFGGAEEPEIIVELVRHGELDLATVDASVRRILTQKFQQGLFENPYVDVAAAARIVGNPGFKALSGEAQRRSVVLIKNDRQTLPLTKPGQLKLYLYGVDRAMARARGFAVVDSPEQADLALMALSTPFEVLHPMHFFGARYREGDTGFRDGDPAFEQFKRVSATVPTVVSLYLERPADLSGIAGRAAAIVGHFGLEGDALFDVLGGLSPHTASLPYDLLWHARGARATGAPVAWRRGEGLRYERADPLNPSKESR
nr:glycoside hydrolase family 3 N-terminal domain-containing protein [uncultured Duganella sp.]